MSQYFRHSTTSDVAEILSLVEERVFRLPNSNKRKVVRLPIAVSDENIDTFTSVGGKIVNLTGLRMRTFAVCGTICVQCGLAGKYFALERDKHQESSSYHLNLYGVNAAGNEILFTHDHILARSLGGRDDLSNSQTMCSPCNNRKGNYEHTILRKLRERDCNETL